jgi:hypothetical protein
MDIRRDMHAKTYTFTVPPMSGIMWVITIPVSAMPFVFAFIALQQGSSVPLYIALSIILLIIWVWVWMRPSHYVVGHGGLTIVWPLRRLHMPAESILGVRVLDRRQLKEELGWAMRIGVGGLFGAFGLLWTQRRGLIRFYITRLDRYVLIERRDDRPILITVNDPDGMVEKVEELGSAEKAGIGGW